MEGSKTKSMSLFFRARPLAHDPKSLKDKLNFDSMALNCRNIVYLSKFISLASTEIYSEILKMS